MGPASHVTIIFCGEHLNLISFFNKNLGNFCLIHRVRTVMEINILKKLIDTHLKISIPSFLGKSVKQHLHSYLVCSRLLVWVKCTWNKISIGWIVLGDSLVWSWSSTTGCLGFCFLRRNFDGTRNWIWSLIGLFSTNLSAFILLSWKKKP